MRVHGCPLVCWSHDRPSSATFIVSSLFRRMQNGKIFRHRTLGWGILKDGITFLDHGWWVINDQFKRVPVVMGRTLGEFWNLSHGFFWKDDKARDFKVRTYINNWDLSSWFFYMSSICAGLKARWGHEFKSLNVLFVPLFLTLLTTCWWLMTRATCGSSFVGGLFSADCLGGWPTMHLTRAPGPPQKTLKASKSHGFPDQPIFLGIRFERSQI